MTQLILFIFYFLFITFNKCLIYHKIYVFIKYYIYSFFYVYIIFYRLYIILMITYLLLSLTCEGVWFTWLCFAKENKQYNSFFNFDFIIYFLFSILSHLIINIFPFHCFKIHYINNFYIFIYVI